MGNIHNTVANTRFRNQIGFAGQVITDRRNVENDAHNAAGTTPQVSSWVVTADGGSDPVSIVFDGRGDLDAYTFSFTTSSGASTNAGATAEIVEALNKDVNVQRFGFASAASNTLSFTAPQSGTEFAFTAVKTSAILGSISTVAATDAAALLIGTAVFTEELAAARGWISSLASLGPLPQPGAKGLIKPLATYLTTEVKTLTVGGVAEDDIPLVLRIEDLDSGRVEVYNISTGTSATTSTIAEDLVDAAVGSTIVTADHAAAVGTFTATKAGAPFLLEVFAMIAGTATFTVATTTAAASAQEALAGILVYSPVGHDGRILGEGGATELPANEQGRLLEEGFCTVIYSGTAPARNGKVYVGTSSSEAGKFYTAAGTDRHEWLRARFTGVSDGSLAVLRLGSAL